MRLKRAFEKVLQRIKGGRGVDEDPVSIVLLLRGPQFPTLAQLREVSGKAFGTSFSDDRSARHSVYQRGVIFTLANVGSHTLSFLFMAKPYGDDSEVARKFKQTLGRSDQHEARKEHKAYLAVDYVRGQIDTDAKYVVLARLCAELCGENCVAIYLPKESALVSGEQAIRRQLNKIIAYRDVNVS